jgi:hypothetical protein
MAFTYRPSKKIEAEIEEIKNQEGIKTNSKVLDYVISLHRQFKSEIKNQENKIRDLEKELNEIKSILKRKHFVEVEYQKLIDSMIKKI